MLTIDKIVKKVENGQSVLSAQLTIKSKDHTVYFRVPAEFDSFVSVDGSPFLAAILPVAMVLGEDIKVCSSVSQQLMVNSEAIMDKFFSWNIGMKKINIQSQSVIPDKVTNRHGDTKDTANVGVFFSGGVDSFYSFLKNQHEAANNITHFILVHGFDIELSNNDLFDVTKSRLSAVAESCNIRLIPATTNIRQVTDRYMGWHFAHGGSLAMVALSLRLGFNRIIIPSTDSYEQIKPVFPWGSHPELDYLWSTESLQVIHDGSEANRVEKIVKYISRSQLALENLRVCFRNIKGKYNCCRCSKCLRTMIELRAAGVLQDAKTFPEPINPHLVMKIDTRTRLDRVHIVTALEFVESKGTDPELALLLRRTLDKRQNTVFQTIRDKVNKLDQKYNSGKLYKFLSRHQLIK